MQKLLIATSNPGKLGEYRQYLSDFHLELVSLQDVGLFSIDETGATFEENAILKARTYFKRSGLPCISDDGGLEVDFLHGEPGVMSHRWKTGDENATDDELIDYTIERMRGVPDGRRGARLRLVMAFADKEGNIHTSEAAIEGTIAHEPAANRIEGFPFRAVLKVSRFNKMYDDLAPEEHEEVNHRRLALMQLKSTIRAALCQTVLT